MSAAQRLRPLAARLALLFSVIGPGIITANVDNDAGGITTYSLAGAHYGYATLWIMPLLAVVLIIVQEMSARLGVVTGKGLADLIRESLGVRVTALVVVILLVANLANTVSEFAGVAASLEIFGVSKFVSVPVAAVLVWLLIVRGDYKTTERVFLAASLIYLTYVAAVILERPDWPLIGRALVTPSVTFDSGYLVIAVTIIGTTVAPWMQFYQQSAIADKGLKPADYRYARLDVVVGSLFAIGVAAFITISCAATIFANGTHIETAGDAALALRSLAGRYAFVLFGLGLLNASLFSAAILPLSTAYVVCEAFGWESGVSRKLKDAPAFFGIFTAFIVIGAGIILLPLRSLIQVMMASQTLNGILLPLILVVMLVLVNDRDLLGKRFVNRRFMNAVSIVVIAALGVLSLMLLVTTIAGA
jgi:NRAMP (natural resistance-associated macrophage protein)-like metal ion transporter